jgi:hypothetical protein
MGLDGPSRTIIVEPTEAPARETAPPAREPEHSDEPEKVPVGAP